MRRPGFIGMLSLLAGLVLAVPIAIVGFEFLQQDRQLLGVVFLGLAIMLVWLPEYVRIRMLPRPWQAIKQRLAGRGRTDDDR